MRILFITSSRIGDAVLSTGLLAHLLERHPGARVTVVSGPEPAELFAAVPGLERVIRLVKGPGSLHWLRLWLSCVGRRWDLVVDLRGSAVAWLLPAAARRVKRGGLGQGHMIRQLARVLDLDVPPESRVWVTREQEAAAALLVPPGTPVLGVAPVANWRGKEWRAASFVELIRRVVGEGGILPGGRVAVLGAADERARAGPVLESVPRERLIDLVGRVDLPTAYLCLGRCAFFVGNDSAPMHLAAAAGTPTLGLFGPSRHELYAPWGRATAVVRTPESYEELIGRPGYHRLRTDTLMDGLSVDAAERAARALWTGQDALLRDAS